MALSVCQSISHRTIDIRNDNGNTLRVFMVESMLELLHRVTNTGQYSEVFRSSSLTPLPFPKLAFPIGSFLVFINYFFFFNYFVSWFSTWLAFDLLIVVCHFLACPNLKNNI